jgi:hypothetical protein
MADEPDRPRPRRWSGPSNRVGAGWASVSLSTGQTGPRGIPANTASTFPPAAATAFAA